MLFVVLCQSLQCDLCPFTHGLLTGLLTGLLAADALRVLLLQFQLHLHRYAKVCKASRWLLSVAKTRGIYSISCASCQADTNATYYDDTSSLFPILLHCRLNHAQQDFSLNHSADVLWQFATVATCLFLDRHWV